MQCRIKKQTSQQKNYSRIPKFILESKSITFHHKKILIFLYAIQIHSVVPIDNIIRGWLNKKTFQDIPAIPSQLRILLNELEEKKFLTINRSEFNKILSITLIEDKAEISDSKYLYVQKVFFSTPGMSLEHCAVATVYQYYDALTNIYASRSCKLLGIDEKTFRKYANQLTEKEFLSTKTACVRDRLRNFTLSVKYLKSCFIMHQKTNLTVSQSIHKGVDDISWLKNIFINKYTNNTLTKEILNMEKKKSGYDLDYFLNLKDEKFQIVVKSIQYSLKISGTTYSEEVIFKRTKEYLIENAQKNHSMFIHEKDFFTYMVTVLKPKSEMRSSLMDYLDEKGFLKDVVDEVKKETGNLFGESYLKWKIKRAKDRRLFKSYYSAQSAAMQFLLRDERLPYSTLDWDEDYNPEESSQVEKDVLRRKSESLKRMENCVNAPVALKIKPIGSKNIHIEKKLVQEEVPSPLEEFFNIKVCF